MQAAKNIFKAAKFGSKVKGLSSKVKGFKPLAMQAVVSTGGVSKIQMRSFIVIF